MKFTKMSLVAALLIGSSAFALDNVKMSGDAKLFYSTNDAAHGADAGYRGIVNGNTKNDGSLFSKDNSAADAALNLNVTADLAKNSLVSVSAGAGYTVLSTLGLENNFVSNVWGSSHTATTDTAANYANVGTYNGAKVENANWMTEAWIAVTAGKTTLKLGRMELDTPLAFTETWSVEKNTFEAAVVINQDIPDTTLVGAWVGNGNGNENLVDANSTVNTGAFLQSNVQQLNLATGAVVNGGGKFGTYGKDGAYAIGAINNSFKPVTAQAWYYNVLNVAKAYWLQADLNMEGILAGAQYCDMKADVAGAKSDNVYALMLGYEMKDVATVKASYSKVNKDGSIGGAGFNTATSTGASKLYTEAWWNYGYVTRQDATSYALSAEANAAGVDLLAQYTHVKDKNTAPTADVKMDEFTLTAGKSFGPLDTTLAYVYTKADDKNIKNGATKGSAFNTIQAYLTLNF